MFRRLAATVLTLAASGSAQSLELRSGEVLLGRVTAIDATQVTVAASYPEPRSIIVPRADLTPRSLFQVLAERGDQGSAAGHVALAESALRLGLPAHAMAELREAVRLDPTRQATLSARIQGIREQIAAGLLQEATDALGERRWPEAKLTLAVLMDRYQDTKAGPRARELQPRVLELARKSGKNRDAGADEIQRALKTAAQAETEADKLAQGLPVTAGDSVKEQRQRERVVQKLEAAWHAVMGLMPRADVDLGTAELLTRTQERVRTALGSQYMALASAFVQRRAIPTAESYNQKACGLDPESGGCRHLQDLIVQARLVGGYGAGF